MTKSWFSQEWKFQYLRVNQYNSHQTIEKFSIDAVMHLTTFNMDSGQKFSAEHDQKGKYLIW